MATVSAAEPVTGFVDAPGGGKLGYEVRGEGAPIVFLHDGLVASATWDHQFDLFAKSFRAIRYDRRGFGRSAVPKGPYSDVDDLQAVFESLKIGRAVLVGCSNGSRLAVDYALAHPDRVEALVLVGPVVSGLPYSEHFLRRGLVNYRPMFRPDEVARRELTPGSHVHDIEKSRRLFDYDAKAPLDIKEAGTESRGDIRVLDLSFASPMGGRVPAYLILPPGEGKHPAVLFLHPGQGDRKTFLDEAVGLAKDRGFVSLTISAPFLRPENQGKRGGNPWNPEASRKEQIQTIVDLRRGFDLLVARPEVDPKRLAYVGHSLGATVGGTLAGIEKRPIAFVLMAGYPSLTHGTAHGDNQGSLAFQELLTPEQQKAYVDALEPIDALHYVGHAAPAKLLFQFAKRDEFISPWDAAVYVQVASEPKEVKWYDTDHYFNDEARRDRGEWLERVLGIP